MSLDTDRAARRLLRDARHNLTAVLRDLAPVRKTAQRIPEAQTPPSPGDFRRFGKGSWVVPPASVLGADQIDIGSRVTILEFSSVLVTATGAATGITIGDGVRLARFNAIKCDLAITIADNVSSSDSATVFDAWHFVDGLRDAPPLEPAPVAIGEGAYLGCNSTVCPGVTIGKGAYVGEGAVVFDDVPDHTVVFGNPAVVVRRYDSPSASWE